MVRMAFSPLLVVLAILAASEDSPGFLIDGAPPIDVVRFGWERIQHLPPMFAYGLFPVDVGRVPPGARLQLLPGDPSTPARPTRRNPTAGINPSMAYVPGSGVAERDVYWYSVKVRNLSRLPIQTVVWEYVFRDPGSGTIQGVVQGRNDAKIKPGNSKTLEAYTLRPPVTVVSVATLNKKKEHEGESIVIVEVVFSDQSVWHNPRVTTAS